jgi:WD40 repeat protein
VLRGHEDAVKDIHFSPDARYILSASDDKTARVWDATSGTLVAILHGPTKRVTGARFSPDGKSIVTTGEDGAVRVYLTELAAVVALAKARVTRELTCQERVQFLRETLTCPTPTPANQ